MAEGFAKHMLSEDWNVYSAGVESHGLNPFAVEVMREVGIDISGQRSKMIQEVSNVKPDVVITLCSHAKEVCPSYNDAGFIDHWDLGDPADATGSHEDKIKVYRLVRDEIKKRIEKLIPRFDKAT